MIHLAPSRLNLNEAFQRGLACHRAGNLGEAERLYRAILAAQPDHRGALHLLGLAAHQRGQNAAALGLIDRAMAAGDGSAEIESSRGRVLAALGRPEEALASFERAATLQPEAAAHHGHCGNTLLALQRFDAALARYDRALALQPGHPEALSNRGIALHHLRHYEAALASFDEALALAPGLADAHANRAGTLRALGRLAEALTSLRQAARLQPGNSEMQANLARALSDRAAALESAGQFEEALAAAEEALERCPDLAEAHHNRSLALHAAGRLEAALASAERALALQSGFAEAHHNRGVVLQAAARFDEALASYREALRHRPDFAAAHCAEASLLLLCGDLARGWPKYEWRWQTDAPASRRTFSVPQWRGDADLAGKTILLHAEQGFGDTIQFCRYAPLVAQHGASVLLDVQPPLLPLLLLRGLAGPVQVVGQGERLPAFDLHCPLLSLPLAFGTTLEAIPASIPYLTAPPGRVEKMAALLPAPTSLRVGLVWSGNPAHRNDRNRSIALERLAPLLGLPGIAFVSLQRDLSAEDAAALARHSDVALLGRHLGDFADTAAIVASLDLVIAVDTAVAHLAGALGKRCWLLLPHLPDWRWLLDREDSPWYPTLRLFRQPKPGDWGSVIARVAGELVRLAGG